MLHSRREKLFRTDDSDLKCKNKKKTRNAEKMFRG